MPRFIAVASALVAALAALPAVEAGMYTKKSGVLELDARSYPQLIAKSNYTSIVEFYAPWCGHCQNLKPVYERAANNLKGLAKVAAIDCDDDANKQFCGSMGVQGFPTLKIVRPSKKAGAKPVVEDYRGERSAKAIVEAVAENINNHVTRLTDKTLDAFLAADKPKFVLFTDKGTTSALLRSIAIDYLDTMSVGQIRNKEKAAVDKFAVTKFPTLMLFPGKDKDEKPTVYEGELKKDALLEFLSQVGPPNPDPAPAKAKGDKRKSTESTTSSTDTTSSETAAATPNFAPIAAIADKDALVDKCLQPKSLTCVLALVPEGESEAGTKVIDSLSQLNSKYLHGKRHLFPFYSVPSNVDGDASLRKALGLGSGVELIVVNARRGWWKGYEGDFGVASVEGWIDAIRMGEGKKDKLPDGVVVEEAATPEEQPKEQPRKEPKEEPKGESSTEAEKSADAEETKAAGAETEKVVHEEL